MVPSRYGVFSRYTTFPCAFTVSRFSATVGRAMVAPGILPPATLVHPCTSYRHSRSRTSRWRASQLTPACKENPFAFATRSLRGSSPASGLIVRSTSALRPACGPTAMR